MNLVPMRFGGVSWRHNPREIRFAAEKNVRELVSPFALPAVQDVGRRCMTVRGEGELYGADCLEQFERLLALFRREGTDVLSIAGIKPFYAVFEELAVVGEPKPDVLTYRFVFREAPRESGEDKPTVHTAAQGESLWDISYRCGVGIDALVALNPQVKRPDEVAAGEEVRLC